MPQISKVRIVNFNYNDGNRLIADELYDFSSKEQDVALNVLINLANGGGKSVLVQLMLQPIVPKAKVAGRRIESFFNKSGDHCFVLLEWLKDNSREKLLTGIAMSAGESLVGEDDSIRGMSVKYYTFYSNYVAYNTQYDIINLPLSKKENGKFIAADFDIVRTLARKSNGILNYYVSDDKAKWQKKIDEYGLSYDEWKMMEKLNSEEGGLSKYFGNFKSSDNLIDKLLIPTIEGKLNQARTKEDSSLSTMLLSYAKEYVSKQTEIENKEIYELFEQKLSMLLPKAEALNNANDSLKNSIGKLFGLQNALNIKLIECKTSQKKYNADIENLDAQIKRIEHEKVSAEYYYAKDEFEEVNNNYLATEERKKRLIEKLKSAKYSKAVLESADYYKNLLKIQGVIKSIQAEINMRESGADNADELASLKYSVFAQVCEFLEKFELQAKSLKSELSNLLNEKQESEQEYKQAENNSKEAETEYIRTEATLRTIKNETENELSQLGIEIFRRLDGAYELGELKEFRKNKETQLSKLNDNKTEFIAEQAKIEDELSAIPQQKADLEFKRKDFESQKNIIKDKLAEYYVKEEKIKNICNEYNLDFSMRFSDNIISFLNSKQRENTAKSAEIIRKISISQEEINAANKGYLHVPALVIDYLNSTGVRYSTCEKYLTEQIEVGKLTSDECLEILKNYPATAYGVLMDQDEKKRFFLYGREKWLPAMIPLFTYEQMAQILKNARKFDGAIAFYSEEYFTDKTMYVDNLKNIHNNLLNQQKLLIEGQEKLRGYIDIAKIFDYTEYWEGQQKEIVSRFEDDIKALDDEELTLNELSAKLKDKKITLINQIKELDESIYQTQFVLNGIDKVEVRIEDENRYAQLLIEAKSNRDVTLRKMSLLKTQIESLSLDIDTLNIKLTSIENEINELTIVKNEIGDCSKAEIITGHWRELFDSYKFRQNAINQELLGLKQQRESYNKQIEFIQNELNHRNLDLDEYKEVIYSSKQLDDVNLSIKQLSVDIEKVDNEFFYYTEKIGRVRERLESAKNILAEYGDSLERAEVGTNFDLRINALHTQIRSIYKIKDESLKKENTINSIMGRLNDRINHLTCPKTVPIVKLEESEKIQYEGLVEYYKKAMQQFNELYRQVKNDLQEMKEQFSATTCGFYKGIEGMINLISNDKRGDSYFTLTKHIEAAIKNSQKIVAQIITDLREFESNHNDLVHQCTLQGERIYEGLLQMASSSRVTVYEGKDKKQMIRFDIPAQVDPIVATASITNEIDKGTKELVARLSDDSFTDVDNKKIADKIISSRNLLRKYIGRECIRVDAYKIDQNPQNAGYRTWEQTQVNNSGAEKFVVYFAVILSLMNYTRGDFGDIRDKDLRSVLILDNPFGATSSKHILTPMFAIAKHFRVQMICLSDINKTDVVNCFDINIKAIVKKIAMSNKERLTHEGNETIEHGYYRSEQISLL